MGIEVYRPNIAPAVVKVHWMDTMGSSEFSWFPTRVNMGIPWDILQVNLGNLRLSFNV